MRLTDFCSLCCAGEFEVWKMGNRVLSVPMEVGQRGSLNFRSLSVNTEIEGPEIAGEK